MNEGLTGWDFIKQKYFNGNQDDFDLYIEFQQQSSELQREGMMDEYGYYYLDQLKVTDEV